MGFSCFIIIFWRFYIWSWQHRFWSLINSGWGECSSNITHTCTNKSVRVSLWIRRISEMALDILALELTRYWIHFKMITCKASWFIRMHSIPNRKFEFEPITFSLVNTILVLKSYGFLWEFFQSTSWPQITSSYVCFLEFLRSLIKKLLHCTPISRILHKLFTGLINHKEITCSL